MAKAKKTPKPKAQQPGKNQTNTRRKLTSEGRTLQEDFADVSDLSSKFFNQNPLTRIDDRRSGDTQNLINLRLAYADPANASFAGRRSSDMTDILSRMKSGLEGYTAPEMNAFREKQTRGMDSDLNTSMNSVQREQNKSRTLGASSMAQKMELMRQDREKRNDLDQDLFIKNADEKKNRLKDYGSAVSGAETAEFDRGQGAINSLETTLNTDNADRTTKQQWNAGQERGDRAGEMAQRFGLMGMIQTMRDRKQQNKLMGQSIKKGGSAQQSSANPYGDYSSALMDYINKMGGTSAEQGASA